MTEQTAASAPQINRVAIFGAVAAGLIEVAYIASTLRAIDMGAGLVVATGPSTAALTFLSVVTVVCLVAAFYPLHELRVVLLAAAAFSCLLLGLTIPPTGFALWIPAALAALAMPAEMPYWTKQHGLAIVWGGIVGLLFVLATWVIAMRDAAATATPPAL